MRHVHFKLLNSLTKYATRFGYYPAEVQRYHVNVFLTWIHLGVKTQKDTNIWLLFVTVVIVTKAKDGNM